MEFIACYVDLMPEGTLRSFTVCDVYGYFAGQALTSKSSSRTEYLTQTDNILVHD